MIQRSRCLFALAFAGWALCTCTGETVPAIPQTPDAGAPERSPPPVPDIDTDPVFKSLPPPKLGANEPYHFKEIRVPRRPNEKELPFPPPAELTPPKLERPVVGALKVTRHQPDGAQEIVGAVSATFNQPMVPLASLDDLKAHPVPLEIEPLPPGRFRWLGTATVEFEPEGRIPFATKYTVRIPVTAKSEAGKTLANEASWTFETPRPVVTFTPGNNFGEATLDQLIQLSFNQSVAPDAAMKGFSCVAGGQPIALVSSHAENDPFKDNTAADVAVQRKLFEERNVFARPAKPLPPDTVITCTLAAGFHSLEGPLPTTKPQQVTFRTYPPLILQEISCGWADRCIPRGGITARFNNVLDQDQDQDFAELVHLEPEVANLNVSGAGYYLSLSGDFQPSTTYHVRIDSRIEDTHKQHLEKDGEKDIKMGEADPELTLGGAPHAVLEAVGPRVIPVHSTNVQHATLRWFRLDPKTFRKALNLASQWFDRNHDPFASLTPAATRIVDLGKRDNKSEAKGLEVDEILGKDKPGILLVDLESRELASINSYEQTHRAMVVQVTDLGVTAHLTDDTAVVLVTSLSTGRPVAGAQAMLIRPDGTILSSGETDARGIAELSGPASNAHHGEPLLIDASKGEDQALLVVDQFRAGEFVSSYNYNGLTSKTPTVVSSVFTDRQPYRPGETVRVAGTVQIMTHGVKGAVEPLPEGARIKYQVTDNRGTRTHSGIIDIGALGMFSVDVKIAPDAFLGRYTFSGGLEKAGAVSGQAVYTSFDVEEYRTPEYKVSIDTGEPLHFVGDQLQAKVHGEYFFGGGMSGAPVSWSVTRVQGSFAAPGNAGFTFSDIAAIRHPYEWGRFNRTPVTSIVAQGTGVLDASGVLAVATKLDAGEIKGPVSFQVQATVTDANRQAISANATVLAHAGASYAGLKLERAVAKEAESIEVSAITVDVDGKRLPPPGAVELAERTWVRVKNKSAWEYEEKDTAVSGCGLNWNHSLADAATCRLKPPKAGNYVVHVHAKDSQGRENMTSTTLWVYGKGWTPWFQHNEQASVELVADKPDHEPGETARVMIRSPFPKSVGILAVQREGLIEYRALDFEGEAHGEEIALTEAEVPNVVVTVSLVRGRISPDEAGSGDDDSDDAGRPMYAGGSLTLPISTRSHAITVAVGTEKPAIEPGGSVKLKIHTVGSEGQPLAARLAIAIVDEGVLSLLGYSIPNPLAQIFLPRSGQGGDVSEVPLVLEREQKLQKLTTRMRTGGGKKANKAMRAPAQGMFEQQPNDKAIAMPMAPAGAVTLARAHDGHEAPTPVMTARSFFATTAYFAADQQTDTRGELELTVPMPENLTRYRIMVVAAGEGERFGEGDGSVQVRKPVLVRPALPRFLNLGDQFLASAVINNQTESDLWVDAQAKAANGTADAHRQRVLVRAGQAKEVAFEASAGLPGVSRWQFSAVALAPERWNDAAELDVPVQLPATVEAFATYGSTDKSVLQPLQLPKDALPDFGALEVSMSSTALTSLTDSVAYLWDYPYECVEQTASRILPFIVLRKIITDFHIPGASTQEARDNLINVGLKRIWSKQRYDGGFGYWSDSQDSYLYVSSWAAFVIARAQRAGYSSDSYELQRLKDFLQARLRRPRVDLGEDLDYSSQAMAALALSMLDVKVPDLVQRIYGHRGSLAIYGKAWLMEAARGALGANSAEEKELNREIQSAAVEKPSSAHFAEAKTESIRLLMHSNERTDAIVLATLVHVRPQDPLIPKIIHGLNESRSRGRWDTTQSNAWGTVAVSDYYDVFEKVTPHFDANIFVGDGFVGQGQFSGRETKILTERVPLAAISEQRKTDLVLEKNGAGRLYYRLGLKYAPKDLKLAPEAQGFTVTRTYLPMADSPGSVTTSPDGTVHIQAGADVRVELRIVVADRAEFVAVDDPLPAGLEAVNTSFLTNQSSRVLAADGTEITYGRPWWAWWWSPFTHTEMRDDRVVLFSDRLAAGVYTHTYVARATTKGTFQVAPTRAFEMYEPENFGRTSSAVVEVK